MQDERELVQDSADPTPKTPASTDFASVDGSFTVISETALTSMKTTPNTTWWMCIPPGSTFPGHHRTCARIMRTLNRMTPNPTMNAHRKTNSGSRPRLHNPRTNQPPSAKHRHATHQT